jgi:hypothetical protein
MTTVQLKIEEIPHGHGASFKKGIASILVNSDFSENLPNGYKHSYERGQQIGNQFKNAIAELVKD